MYVDIQDPDFEYLNKEYHNLDDSEVDLPEYRIKFYKILNDTIFEYFKPNEKTLEKIEVQLLKAGVIRLPPDPEPQPEE